MKNGTFLLLIVFACFHLVAQHAAQDCLGALPLCSNGLSVPLPGFHGPGNTQDLLLGEDCLIQGENNSVWYKFTTIDSGLLAFDIIPVGPDDYDFSLYNLTGHSCQEIITDTLLPVRCSFAATMGHTTGLRPNYNSAHASVSGDTFLAPLQVYANETFVLLVDNYTANGQGYTIKFDSSTTTLSDSGGITNLYADSLSLYNMNYTTVFFTQPLLCNSILADGSQFQINGSSRVSVDSVIVGCNGVTQEVVLYFDPPITIPDNYTIDVVAGTNGTMLTNVCGVSIGQNDVAFMVNTVVNAGYTYSINKQSSNTVTFINTTTFNSRINTTLSHYEWDFGDGTLSNDENPVHTFNGTPPFTVTLSAITSEGARFTYSKTFTQGTFNGIETPNSLTNLSIHPNPTQGNITLMGLNNPNVSLQIEVYNTLGHRVHAEQIPAGTGNNTQLNLNGQPAGIYFLRVSDGEHSKTIRLVVE